MTAAAALAIPAGSIGSVGEMRLRLSGKPPTRAPTSNAASPSAPLTYNCTLASRFSARQLRPVSSRFMAVI